MSEEEKGLKYGCYWTILIAACITLWCIIDNINYRFGIILEIDKQSSKEVPCFAKVNFPVVNGYGFDRSLKVKCKCDEYKVGDTLFLKK